MNKFSRPFHAGIFATLSLCLLYILHILPVNQLFIDPFSEAIKHHDVMDIAFSKFRNHDQPHLFDHRIFIINSGVTDRQKLTKTLEILHAKGARAIGLDLLLDTLYQMSTDTLLRDAIQQASDKMVLGYSLDENAHKLTNYIHNQSLPFFNHGINKGYVNLATNDGFTVRAFVPILDIQNTYIPAFSTQLASMLDSTVLSKLRQRAHNSEWINFRRLQPGTRSMIFPINSKKSVHYILADMDKFIADSALYDPGFFKNKIVLIGFCGESEKALSMSDRYFTPLNEQYTGRSLPDMYGVVIHANIISMLLDKDFIEEVSSSVIYLLSFLIFFINFLCFQNIIKKHRVMHSVYVRFFQLLEFIILFTIAITALAFWNWKLGFFMIATSIIISFELFHIYERNLDLYIENKITFLRKFRFK